MRSRRFSTCVLLALLASVALSSQAWAQTKNSQAQSSSVSAVGAGAKKEPFSEYVAMYCHKFQMANKDNLDMLFDDMEASPYPDVYAYLSTPSCQPKEYGSDVKMPSIQFIADDTVKNREFLEITQTYFDFIQKPQLFKQLLNAKNTKNETLLDYLETRRRNRSIRLPALQEAANFIIKFACSKGGAYSYHAMSCDPAGNPVSLAQMDKLALAGDLETMRKLGEAYQYGVSAPKDPEKAFYYFGMAARTGDKDAMSRLAHLREFGIDRYGVDLKEAISLYEKLGWFDSIAYIYKSGGKDIPANRSEALRWYMKAYASGNKRASTSIAAMYREDSDYKNALRWYKIAESQGDFDDSAEACLYLAQLYWNGQGTVIDYGEAFKWYRAYVEKKPLLGNNQRVWFGLVDNVPGWASTVERYARTGNVQAQYLMAVYLDRDEPKGDHVASARWYKKAAEQGDVEAQCVYSSLLELGIHGVAKDPVEARIWRKKSAAQGHPICSLPE